MNVDEYNYVTMPDNINIAKMIRVRSSGCFNVIKVEPDDESFETRYFEERHNAETYAHVVGRCIFEEYRKPYSFEDNPMLSFLICEGDTEESKFGRSRIDWQNLN